MMSVNNSLLDQFCFCLIQVYDKIILPTHASCHVHYAIFFICSLDQVLNYRSKLVHNYWEKMVFKTGKKEFLNSKCFLSLDCRRFTSFLFYIFQTFVNSFLDYCWKKVLDSIQRAFIHFKALLAHSHHSLTQTLLVWS
jgi:hypothetical protein